MECYFFFFFDLVTLHGLEVSPMLVGDGLVHDGLLLHDDHLVDDDLGATVPEPPATASSSKATAAFATEAATAMRLPG